jgi:hypothetical protein
MLDMKRRELIALLGGGGLLLAAKVKRARGQQPAMPVVGFLHSGSPELRDEYPVGAIITSDLVSFFSSYALLPNVWRMPRRKKGANLTLWQGPCKPEPKA